MYKLLHSLGIRDFLRAQLPVIVVSLAIAELFYKFHSFLLEACAFLATWLVLDFVYQTLRTHAARGPKTELKDS